MPGAQSTHTASSSPRNTHIRCTTMADSTNPVYNIAGPAGDEDYAQAEYLAEMLMNSLPNVSCNITPVLPEEWPDFVSAKCAQLGTTPREPLIWMNSGRVVGGYTEFANESDHKYGVQIGNAVSYEEWGRIADENERLARLKASGGGIEPIGTAGSGKERGDAIVDALLLGNERYVAGPSGGDPKAGPPPSAPVLLPEGVVATVLALTPLPAPAHELLGCDEASLFVVPCTPAGIDPLAVGNVEHGLIALGTKALLVLSGRSAELTVGVQACRDALVGADAPLPLAQAEFVKRMMPALSRTLSVVPPTCSAAEAERLCLEEWTRECSDELVRQSAVLHELHDRDAFHIVRGVSAADGQISLV